jgi:hypothetical protein
MVDKEPRKHIKARLGELIRAQAAQIKILASSDFIKQSIDEDTELELFTKL